MLAKCVTAMTIYTAYALLKRQQGQQGQHLNSSAYYVVTKIIY